MTDMLLAFIRLTGCAVSGEQTYMHQLVTIMTGCRVLTVARYVVAKIRVQAAQLDTVIACVDLIENFIITYQCGFLILADHHP